MSESGWGGGQVMEGHVFCIKESRLYLVLGNKKSLKGLKWGLTSDL